MLDSSGVLRGFRGISKAFQGDFRRFQRYSQGFQEFLDELQLGVSTWFQGVSNRFSKGMSGGFKEHRDIRGVQDSQGLQRYLGELKGVSGGLQEAAWGSRGLQGRLTMFHGTAVSFKVFRGSQQGISK